MVLDKNDYFKSRGIRVEEMWDTQLVGRCTYIVHRVNCSVEDLPDQGRKIFEKHSWSDVFRDRSIYEEGTIQITNNNRLFGFQGIITLFLNERNIEKFMECLNQIEENLRDKYNSIDFISDDLTEEESEKIQEFDWRNQNLFVQISPFDLEKI